MVTRRQGASRGLAAALACGEVLGGLTNDHHGLSFAASCVMAVGYSLVFSVLNFSNFAHGAIITLGAYIAWAIMVQFFRVPFLPALLLSILGAGILAFII
jgi:branched-chain amino acid transport system permease protein